MDIIIYIVIAGVAYYIIKNLMIGFKQAKSEASSGVPSSVSEQVKSTNTIRINKETVGDENSLRVNINELNKKDGAIYYKGKVFEGVGIEYFEANGNKYSMEWIYDIHHGQMVMMFDQMSYDKIKGN